MLDLLFISLALAVAALLIAEYAEPIQAIKQAILSKWHLPAWAVTLMYCPLCFGFWIGVAAMPFFTHLPYWFFLPIFVSSFALTLHLLWQALDSIANNRN